MKTLKDLPGKPGETKAVFFKQSRAAITAIKNGFAATTAGDNGAINVWIDDKGKLRAERMVYCSTKDSFKKSTVAELEQWIKAALKLIK